MTAKLTPARRVEGLQPYRPSGRLGGEAAVRLHANEGRSPLTDSMLTKALEDLRVERYPSVAKLESQLAEFHGVHPDRLVLTAGLDDALFRLSFALLEPGRRAALCVPTFEMIPRYIQLSGGQEVGVPWLDSAFPEGAFAEALSQPEVAVGFLCSPSSPAGEVVGIDTLDRLAQRASSLGRVLVVDLAYVEFADEDPTDRLVARGDVCVARTFSKAVGLASLRVGYVIAPPEIANWLRTVGQPYAVSGPSLSIASVALPERGQISAAAAERVQEERRQLFESLLAIDAAPIESQGNFVLARLGDRAPAFVDTLASKGFRVRLFSTPRVLNGAVRIACPQNQKQHTQLLAAIRDVSLKGRL